MQLIVISNPAISLFSNGIIVKFRHKFALVSFRIMTLLTPPHPL